MTHTTWAGGPYYNYSIIHPYHIPQNLILSIKALPHIPQNPILIIKAPTLVFPQKAGT